MTSRFHWKGHQITETIEKVMFDGFAYKTVDKIALTELSLHFGDDISTSRLRSELCVLANIPQTDPIATMSATVKIIKDLGGIVEIIPNVKRLLQPSLILPSSTASAERSFSTLRRMKTYLRSTMSQQRLNHVLILSTYTEMVDLLDINIILAEFIRRNELRRSTFALP